MKITILGLSITSSWGNGHATTYRALVRALAARGHDVLFLERSVPWYAANQDLPAPPYCRAFTYTSLADLEDRFGTEVETADLVIVGSYVPEGIAVGDFVLRQATGVTAFYDIDTPVTLAHIDHGRIEYLAAEQIRRYDLFLSFCSGPTLDLLHDKYGARMARPLYCAVDPEQYRPDPSVAIEFDLGYLGTYSRDRQPPLERLMLRPARTWSAGRFIVAGPQYPAEIRWPANVARVEHLPPDQHRRFYNQARYTLNITRKDMVRAGYSPSVRLFEAAACGTPIISDVWKGIDRFFTPAVEILLSSSAKQTLGYLRDLPEEDRLEIGRRARDRVLRAHTAEHRAIELEEYVAELAGRASASAQEPASGVERTTS
ncbi:MAG TPA: glycosyltransferase [Vicinamibacterales bacterium]|nr:glycosyltransferase [Vicinamibacterales bacterium]